MVNPSMVVYSALEDSGRDQVNEQTAQQLPRQQGQVSVWSSVRHEKLPAMKRALDEMVESSTKKSLLSMATDEEISSSQLHSLDVTGYLEAVEKAPKLIENESDPLLFLLTDDGDAKAASRRLLSYWAWRKNLFGVDRAYLPMKPGAALGEEELGYLRFCSFSLLPCNLYDQSVVCFNTLKRPKGAPTAKELRMRARCMFYVYSLACANRKSQIEGFVFLSVANERTSIVVPNRRLAGELLSGVFPMKINRFILAGCFPVGMKRLFTDHMLPTLKHQYGACVREGTKAYVGESFKDICQKLQGAGFEPRSLPSIVGGTYDYTDWTTFLNNTMEKLSGDLTPTIHSLRKRKERRQDSIVTSPVEAKVVHHAAPKYRKMIDHTYRDYSQVPPQPGYHYCHCEQHQPLLDVTEIAKMPFVEKIHYLLMRQQNCANDGCNCDEGEQILEWLPHGRAFRVCVNVLDADIMEQDRCKDALNKYFGVNRVAIFILQLRSHGFKQLLTSGRNNGELCFYHECMLRGLPHLVRYMPAPRDPRNVLPDPANEPPFDSISEQYPVTLVTRHDDDCVAVMQPLRKKRKHRRKELAVHIPMEAKVVHAVAGKDRTVVDHTYRDYSQVPPPVEHPADAGEDPYERSFVEKLYSMLTPLKSSQSNPMQCYIRWLPHGRAFQLCNLQELEESKILDSVFRIQNYRASIFLLHLRSHSFKQLTRTAGSGNGLCFYHECMLRGLPHLLRFMPAPHDARNLIPDPDNEPPFASLSMNYPLPG